MRLLPTHVLGVLVLFALPSLAAAEQVTCESKDNRRIECNMDTTGGVHMVRQLSSTRCVEGDTYGVERHAVWVDDGCRAVFETRNSYSSSQYQSGGSTTSNLPHKVTCQSRDNRKVECPMDTRGEVRLTTQHSDTRCVEGQNWGVSKHSVWVQGGCRADFESSGTGPAYDNDRSYGGGSSHNAGGVPNNLVAACNAVEDRYGRVLSSVGLKPGAWEVVLEYDDGRYVCNVEGNGKVTYFEKLRN